MPYGRITPKQQEILDYIKNEILNRGFPPAVREICEAVNLNLLLPFIHIWKHWRKMDISAEMQRNHVRLRLLMTILIWSAERL